MVMVKPLRPPYRKRDIALAVVALVVSLPVLALIGLVVWLLVQAGAL